MQMSMSTSSISYQTLMIAILSMIMKSLQPLVLAFGKNKTVLNLHYSKSDGEIVFSLTFREVRVLTYRAPSNLMSII